MPQITVERHEGIDRSVAPFELRDGGYTRLENLLTTPEALEIRPGRTRHLTNVASLPATGLHRFYRGIGGIAFGPHGAGTLIDDASTGTIPWVNPTKAATQNADYATATSFTYGLTPTHLLKLTGFGFTIPGGDIIKGIRVVARGRLVGAGNVQLLTVQLLKAGVAVGANRVPSPVEFWGGIDEDHAYGGSTDLWETTWTPAQINASDFGVIVQAGLGYGEQGTGPGVNIFLDSVLISIFTAATGSETLFYVGANLYSDLSGLWAAIQGANPLAAGVNLEMVTWRNITYIQDGTNGPYKYDGVTFSTWTSVPPKTPPPIARGMLFDQERLYLYALNADPNAVRASTLDDPDDFPSVPRPSGNQGALMYVGKDDGDYLLAAARLGTTKYFFKRRRTYRLTGDGADTWDLTPQPLFPSGVAGKHLVAECGGVLVWSDGRRVYKFDGIAYDDHFGRPVEEFLRETSLDEWSHRPMAYWNGLLFLWYTSTHAVVYDFRSERWFGPWFLLPCRVATVDRDTDILWMGSSLTGEIWKLDALLDDGQQIAYLAESKAYAFVPGWIHRPRGVSVTADGSLGTVTADLLTSGNPGQMSEAASSRSITFSGSSRMTISIPVPANNDGAHTQLRLSGVGQKGERIYEYSLRGDRVRRV